MPRKRRSKENPDVNQDKPHKPHKHHYKSVAHSEKSRLFHHVKGNNNGVSQNVNVEVNVESEGCFEGLVKAIGACFGRGK